jgi:molecular chaperone HtpG
MNFYTEKPEEKDDKGNVTKEKEIEVEEKTLNSMKPLWLRNKSEIKEEEYEDFYKQSFHAWDKPIDVIHAKAEGKIEYTMLLFIPEKAPYDFYSVNYERGLKLYSKQIFIMDKNKDLLPEYLGFVKGLVDSPDFSLNISREILQHSSQLTLVAKNIEKKILQSLKYMLENSREKYEKFWSEFGRAIKAGINVDFGANSDKIKDLLLFPSSNSDKLTTLKEYVSRMKKEQKEIYYAAGKDKNTVEHLPQLESFKEKGYEVLYFIDKVDEFSAMALREYDGKPIKSIADSSITVDENKEEIKKIEEENKTLLETIKEALKDKVSEVKISSRLKKSPVCITSGKNGLSLNAENVLKEAGQDPFGGIKSEKILELNPEHNIFKTLKSIYEKDAKSEKIKTYSGILYNQALLLEGIPVENPSEFAQQIASLMEEI